MFKIEKELLNEVVVNFVFKDKLPEKLKTLEEKKVFTANISETYSDLDLENKGVIYLGLGNETEENLEQLRMTGFNLGKLLNSRKIEKVSIDLINIKKGHFAQNILEGLIDSQYKFDHYKVEKKEPTLKEVSFLNVGSKDKLILETMNLMAGVFKTRDFVNLTPIDLYPESYANKITELFKDTNVEVEILDKKSIENLGMHSLLAVNKGSDREPRFVVLKYFNNKSTTKHLTLVGKGVTYDSGGYALKPATSMVNMKNDMGGSAAVVGLMYALSQNKLETNVVGVMALTENMINGNAFKNGDVISSMKGTTIEVINTDAEGRLTLADSIYYAATKLESTKIIELSTLTGAAVVALGTHITGVTTEDEEFYNKVHESGNKAGEFNWRLPMTDQLKSSVKSDIAELKNSVAGGGGMMTAGIFLNHFAEDVPFIHLDIAGTAFGSAYKHLPAGASGTGVKTLYHYIKDNE